MNELKEAEREQIMKDQANQKTRDEANHVERKRHQEEIETRKRIREQEERLTRKGPGRPKKKQATTIINVNGNVNGNIRISGNNHNVH